MHDLLRPTAGPLPHRRAIVARFRRLEPRRVLRRLVIGFAALAAIEVGVEWRSTIDALGTTVAVATVQRDVPAGTALGPADIALADWPSGLVPEGASRRLPIGATARSDLVAGEALVDQRLFPDPAGLDAGDRLVTVPITSTPGPLGAGTPVELYGIRPLGDGLTSGSTRLAIGIVVEVFDQSAAIAVAESAVPVVLDHLALGVVDIVVRP